MIENTIIIFILILFLLFYYPIKPDPLIQIQVKASIPHHPDNNNNNNNNK